MRTADTPVCSLCIRFCRLGPRLWTYLIRNPDGPGDRPVQDVKSLTAFMIVTVQIRGHTLVATMRPRSARRHAELRVCVQMSFSSAPGVSGNNRR